MNFLHIVYLKLKQHLENPIRGESFSSLFDLNWDGTLTVRKTVRIGGVQMAPGVRFGTGVSFGGLNLLDYTDKSFRVERKNGIVILTGIYT